MNIFPIRKRQSISSIQCNHALCVVVHQYMVLIFYNPLQSKEGRKTYYSKMQDARCLFVMDGFPYMKSTRHEQNFPTWESQKISAMQCQGKKSCA